MSDSAAGRTLKALQRVAAPLALALVAALLPVAAAPALLPAANAADPCSPLLNAVACENSKPGSPPSEWDITGAGDPDIQGFSTSISVNAGQPISFKVDTNAASYTIGIYRTGWYQGLGARKIADVTPSAFRQTQPQCLSDVTTELYDCGTWAVSATWQVPAEAVSGVYVALLTRPDNGSQSHITFVVRIGRQPFRRRVPDLRYNLAGLQQLRRFGFLPGRRERTGLQDQLQPSGQHPRHHGRPRLLLQQRVPAGPLPGEKRVRRQLPQRAWTPTGTARSCSTTKCSSPWATTNTGRARSGPTWRPHGTPA